MIDRWTINKLGLINFWYFDEEELDLSDGKLLLRGANGSGKSVTMQSFIPLLLDGNKRPERLDPFGTNARKIENYLLVSEDETERTAYLYMEFKKKSSEVYLTIGMGLKAVKGRNVDSWYFIITDGRRVKQDFNLYRDKSYEKTPLTKKELQNQLAQGGFFTENQSRYKEKVNEHLFGYSDIESYDELISLLINIRTPKLSKDFKPTAMYEILENSLRQLTEDDLRPMSEAMENMDNIKLRIEQLEGSLKAAKQIDEYYSKYNNFLLSDKGIRLVEKYSRVKELQKEKNNLQQDTVDISNKIEALEKEYEKLEKELDTAKQKIEEYKDSDVLKAKDKLEQVKSEINEIKKDKEEKDKLLDLKKKKLREKEIQKRETENQKEALEIETGSILEEMDALSEEFSFKQQELFKEDLNLNFIKGAFSKHSSKLKEAKNIVFKFEKTKEEFEAVLLEKDRTEKEVEEVKGKLNEAEEYLTTVKEEHIEKIVKWSGGNKEFKLEEEILKETSRSIMALNNFSELHIIMQKVTESFNNMKATNVLEKQSLEKAIKEFKDEIKFKESKIKELKEAKEVEFERSEEVIKNREALREMKVPFIPLYKAVDFNKSVKEEDKKNIEAALFEMGIMDALIIPNNFKDLVLNNDKLGCDKYLFSMPGFMGYNISEYLTVDNSELGNVKFEQVDDILRSIFLDKNDNTYVNEKGSFGIGILKGKGSKEYELKYIGVAARKQHRERLIESIYEEIEEINKLISSEQEKLGLVISKLETLEKEYSKVPGSEDLHKSLELIDELIRELKDKEKAFISISERYTRLQEDLVDLKKKLYEATEGFDFEKTIKAYEDAEDASRDYESKLTKLEILQNNVLNFNSILENIKDNIEELQTDVDEKIYDLNIKNRDLEQKERQRLVYEELLLAKGYEEIKEQLDKCYEITKLHPEVIRKNRDEYAKLGERLQHYKERVEEKSEQIDKEETILELLKNIFIEEYELNYVTKLEGFNDVYKLCNEVLKIVQVVPNKSKEEYDKDLYDSYTKYSGALRDYQPKVITIFKKDAVGEENKYISQSRERKDIRFRVNGKDVNFNTLKESIKGDIEENKLLLSDKEREFFQDILLKTISNKIKAKIYYSEQWVKKMNDLMQSMNTSSSFKLTLKWVPKKAENEGQLDTRKLVEILQKEQGLVRPEDIEGLSKHFSAKVKEIIRNYEDKKESRNYHTVIKEILDYRKWYEFKLYSKKEGENVKELTNNAFFQLSGGEKAMAMYIPLFTAVYSRYDIADKKDCPRIVSLDEAFAGVDEENIRDMFRILKEMNLDYILNSQVLWGDYDTVDNLAICELVRPDNADYVTVIRYQWNGKEKVCLV